MMDYIIFSNYLILDLRQKKVYGTSKGKEKIAKKYYGTQYHCKVTEDIISVTHCHCFQTEVPFSCYF